METNLRSLKESRHLEDAADPLDASEAIARHQTPTYSSRFANLGAEALLNRRSVVSSTAEDEVHLEESLVETPVAAPRSMTPDPARPKNKRTERSIAKRKQQAQSAAVQNAKQEKWQPDQVEILVDLRSKGVSWVEISREYILDKTAHAIERKWKRLPKGPDGFPIIESDASPRPGTTSSAASSSPTPNRKLSRLSIGSEAANLDVGEGKTVELADDIRILSKNETRLFPEIEDKYRSGHPYFTMLHTGDLSSLGSVIRDHQSCVAFKHAKGRFCRSPLPLAVTMMLSLNDFQSKLRDACGRFRSNWELSKQVLIYLADRNWEDGAGEEYQAFSPRERLNLSGPSIPWQWKDPSTSVLPILIVPAETQEDRREQFSVEVPTHQWDDVVTGADTGPLILLVNSTSIYSTNLKELLRCKKGDRRTGSWSKYQRQSGWVKVMWKLWEGQGSTWTPENTFSLDDENLSENLIEHMLKIHRDLRDGDRENGIGLQEWGNVAEDLLVGS